MKTIPVVRAALGGLSGRRVQAIVIGLVVLVSTGVALHRSVLPIMGHAVQTGLPTAVLDVYHAPELILLALSGLAIAVAGALGPASWATRTGTASALRAE